ncbi:hypothetical protein E2C01_054234 [Portunus trituberculatus]|uniref:Uncharacterized protein n=1 Tax=Portunus trituberculatus TaxID=210409 RepID=A0A5B7GS78_PORTR|nr:hypothetical protein [Portunus trituberculatus]
MAGNHIGAIHEVVDSPSLLCLPSILRNQQCVIHGGINNTCLLINQNSRRTVARFASAGLEPSFRSSRHLCHLSASAAPLWLAL